MLAFFSLPVTRNERKTRTESRDCDCDCECLTGKSGYSEPYNEGNVCAI